MSEFKQQGGLGSTNIQNNYVSPTLNIVRSPSIFMSLVSLIASSNYVGEKNLPEDYSTYNIDEKIEYNDIIKYRQKIEDYYLYNSMIERSYQTLNEKVPAAREKALTRINSHYKDCIGELQVKHKDLLKKASDKIEKNSIVRELIKNNSDEIILCVIDNVKKTCLASIDSVGVSIEEIEMHTEYIVFHAFVECQVLEKP